MSDLRSLLERADRAVDTIPMPQDGLGRLAQRRDHRRRNRRLGSALLAFVIALAAVGSIVTAFRAARTSAPATQRITSSNVGRLRLEWKAPVSGNGELVSITATDGVVVTVGSAGSVKAPTSEDRAIVRAFAEDCASNGGTCQPLWTATVAGVAWIPAAADGVVYVGADDLSAFPARCRTDGGVCQPIWSAKVDPGNAIQPVVSNGVVYVTAGQSPDLGRVYAFATDCGSGGAVCTPSWRSRLFRQPLITGLVADGVLYVGVWPADDRIQGLNDLYAFRVGCNPDPAGFCEPMWGGAVPHQSFASVPAESEGVLYVGTAKNSGHGMLRAYDASCGIEPSCTPLWAIHQSDALNIPSPVVANGELVTTSRFSGRIRAWKLAPDGSTATQLWTACCPLGIADPDPVIADGLVYVASDEGVSAYPLDCPAVGGVCRRVWSSSEPRAGIVRVADGHVFMGGADGAMYVYGLGTPPPARSSASRTWTPVFYAGLALTIAGVAVIRRRRSMR